MPDYDFYHGLYTGQQVDSAVSRALVGGQLDQDIAAIRAAVGSPLVATTAAEMTNINKIYVYTGSEAGYSTGHWYYYEGGSWQDGGLYNSAAADSAMSDSSTNAVQNKVIKEYVDDVRTDLGSDIADVRTDLGADILAEQTRAENVEALKAPLASPALTGTPTAPTAAAGTANTQIATTAYADNAVAVEKARAEAVEATKADKSYADYILLREEEDRQILFGSIVEAAEDTYDELRSAPIHNAITIGGSVYPRMDRTRMAIDAIRGRTVAFNQLAPSFASEKWSGAYGTLSVSGNAATFTVTEKTQSQSIFVADTQGGIPLVKGHKYYLSYYVTFSEASTKLREYVMYGQSLGDSSVQANTKTHIEKVFTSSQNTGGNAFFGIYLDYGGSTSGLSVGSTALIENVQIFDVTAMYNGSIDSETGANIISYVRARLDLDYYASNAGELKAPVVSGVSFVGFNVWDEEWESGGISNTSGEKVTDVTRIRSKNYIPVIPNAVYYVYCPNYTEMNRAAFFDENMVYLGNTQEGWKSLKNGVAFTTASNAHYMLFYVTATSYANDICINVSRATGTPKNGDYLPYQHTSLSIPSTRLDGVGDAQDTMYIREDGENDYSLIKTAKMGLVDLGTLNWGNGTRHRAGLASAKAVSNSAIAKAISAKYHAVSFNTLYESSATDILSIAEDNGVYVNTAESMTGADLAASLSGQYLGYELATPTETVIAEHLTLADISAIAENGGIISIVNETGHIVQPDFVADTVISRSAS